jgi:phenylacetate-coenzyme A ligase PaaK-like adenylate-forming protein
VTVDRTSGTIHPLEAASPEELSAHHVKVLRETVRFAFDKVPFLRERLVAAGISSPGDVAGLRDLARIPITSKKEAGKAMLGLGAFPLSEAKRIFVSPGPHFYASHRRNDPPPERGKTPLALPFHAMGFRENDIVLNTFSYHLTPGGHGIEDQLIAAGCAVIPAGPQNTDVQAQILAKLDVTGYVGTPTFLKLLSDKADELGISPRDDWSLEVAFVTAERLTEQARADLEDRTGARVRQIYGSADGLLPAYECWAAQGMHLHPDQILEVLDRETHEPAAMGEPGEVVATVANPNRPLLRFANLDLVALRDDPCPCGRTGPRIARFVGRADESTKVRGMFVYPEQIAEVMGRYPEVERWQACVRTAADGTDDFCITVVAPEAKNGLAERIAEGIRGLIRLRAVIEIVGAGSIPENATRLVDERS